jgi:peptidyl-prolyl cis-trans isomerase SurA
VLKFMLRFLLLASVWLSGAVMAEAQLLDKVVAVVDEDVIMASELGLQMHMVETQLRDAGREVPPLEVMQKQVLERLIVESIQMQLGLRAGVKVTDEQMSKAFADIAAQNRLSPEQFREQLETRGIPFNMFLDNVRKNIIMQQVQQALVNKRIEVSEQEVEYFLSSEEGKMLASQMSEDARVQQLHTRHILIKTTAVQNDEEAQAVLQKIRVRLAQGEDFGGLAKLYSDDPGSALKGGDLGWVMPGQMTPDFEQVMAGMELNYVSAPFRTEYGWHILQVTEKREQNMNDEILKKQADMILRKRHYQDELPRWLKELRDKTYVQIRL